MTIPKHLCGSPFAKINGRTLRAALQKAKTKHRFGQFSNTQWVQVCPSCDGKILGADAMHPLPFVCPDGVMRTVKDIKPKTHGFESEDLDFCGFSFSRSALDSAIELARLEFDTTKALEEVGADLSAGKPVNPMMFSQMVCEWGLGHRVWANLKRRNENAHLKRMLGDWLRKAGDADDEAAILEGTKIAGLGVSFASKHLRMVAPEKYAVLDDVLSVGLGFALNVKGYRLFLSSLRKFSVQFSISVSLAELEAGIFLMVRQAVRSVAPANLN